MRGGGARGAQTAFLWQVDVRGVFENRNSRCVVDARDFIGSSQAARGSQVQKGPLPPSRESLVAKENSLFVQHTATFGVWICETLELCFGYKRLVLQG